MAFRRPTSLLALLVSGTATLAAAQGCSSSDAATAAVAEAPHTAGEVIALNDNFVWAEASDAEFEKGHSRLGSATARPISRTDRTTARIQQWLDRYHAILTQMMADRGERMVAPKPNVAVYKAFAPNAWVSGTTACTDWSVRVGNSPASTSGTNVFLTPEYAGGMAGLADRCIRPVNWTDKQKFVTFWNGQAPNCTVSSTTTGLLVAGASCSLYSGNGPLTTYATSTTIGVTLDLITWGEEMRVASTLAHELGHYYRAHSNPNVKKHLDFFYRDVPNGPDRPVPAAESAELERTVDVITSSPTPLRLKEPTRYNKRLGEVVHELRSQCVPARLPEATFRALKSTAGTPSQSSEYVAYENKIALCAEQLSMDDAAVRTAFLDLLEKTRIGAEPVGSAPTIDAALANLSAYFDRVDQAEKQITDRMASGQLGWYTNEQEADDIGLELVTRAGFKPEDVIKADLGMYEQLEALYKANNIASADKTDMATCKKWLAADFKEKGPDGNLRDAVVPVGGLTDDHHEGCYRIYNFWRESKRHQYTVGPALPALTPAWSEIQKQASALGGSRPPHTDGNPAGPDDGTTDPGSETDPEETPEPLPPRPPYKRPPPAAAPQPAATTTTVTKEGCSAAPGESGSNAPFLVAFVAGAVVLKRRRRR